MGRSCASSLTSPTWQPAGSLSRCAWVCRWEGNQIETETKQQAAAWQGLWGRAGQGAGARGQRRGAELLPLTLSQAGAPVLPWQETPTHFGLTLAGHPAPLFSEESKGRSGLSRGLHTTEHRVPHLGLPRKLLYPIFRRESKALRTEAVCSRPRRWQGTGQVWGWGGLGRPLSPFPGGIPPG